MTIWFSRRFNGKKKYCSKSISLRFVPRHWDKFSLRNNGAQKGNLKDTCFDFNLQFFGIWFSYTNWDYNR